MNIARFEVLVDRHGEDITTWPLADRGEACALLVADPAASAIVARARSLRSAFDDVAEIRAPRDLAGRIFDRAMGFVADTSEPARNDAAGSTPPLPHRSAAASR